MMDTIKTLLNWISRVRWAKKQAYVPLDRKWFKDEIDGKGSWKL